MTRSTFLGGGARAASVLAELSVLIPSYTYILDGYNQGVGEEPSQKLSSSGHITDISKNIKYKPIGPLALIIV